MTEYQKVDPKTKPVKPFEEIVKQEIIMAHSAIKELYNRLGKTIEEFEEKVEELKADQ